jgi:hypothetical protein
MEQLKTAAQQFRTAILQLKAAIKLLRAAIWLFFILSPVFQNGGYTTNTT